MGQMLQSTDDSELAAQAVRGDREAFGVHGRSAEQRLAIDLLLDNEVGQPTLKVEGLTVGGTA